MKIHIDTKSILIIWQNWFRYSEDINIDESGKNLSRLRYYSVDDNQYINESATILKESLLGNIKKLAAATQNRSSENQDLTKLVEKIEASGTSIAPSYDEYLKLAIVFYNELGEDGRVLYHRVCSLDQNINQETATNSLLKFPKEVILIVPLEL